MGCKETSQTTHIKSFFVKRRLVGFGLGYSPLLGRVVSVHFHFHIALLGNQHL